MFVRINNVLLDPAKVLYLRQDGRKVVVVFDGGERLEFEGPEAAEVWAAFDDDKGWRNDD